MVEEAQCRFVVVEPPVVMEKLVEKAEVDEMPAGMFCAANVEIHREPGLRLLPVKGGTVVMGIHVPLVIPGRAHEGIERVGIPPGRFTACRAGDIHPFGAILQW